MGFEIIKFSTSKATTRWPIANDISLIIPEIIIIEKIMRVLRRTLTSKRRDQAQVLYGESDHFKNILEHD